MDVKRKLALIITPITFKKWHNIVLFLECYRRRHVVVFVARSYWQSQLNLFTGIELAGQFESSQLIRNVLAAHKSDDRFLLFCDARHPDLLRAWWQVYGAIKLPQLRARCGFVLWQEIALVVPKSLSDYLAQSRLIS